MEDYEHQEVEFWRKLWETDVSRSQMLKRSAAAAAGLTVMAGPGAAIAARLRSVASPPIKGRGFSKKEMVAEAKKEGHVNLIALPRDWANYGQMLDSWKKLYGISYTDDNPDGSSAQEMQAIKSLKGDPRAPDCIDVGPSFAVQGSNDGSLGKYFVSTWGTIPRAMKDGRGFWAGDYWGAISIGANAGLVNPIPKTFADLMKPAYKNKVALNGSPLTSNSPSPACSRRRSPTAARSATSSRASNTSPS